jgi:hypothetical protein
MVLRSLARLAALVLTLIAASASWADNPADDAFWYGSAVDGTPTVRLYFFWSASCPHSGGLLLVAGGWLLATALFAPG